jgi:uncharacterized protein (TIGR02453 family)
LGGRSRAAASVTTFRGIPVDALDFYEELSADNSRTFWNANKERYEESVRTPMLDLLHELEPEFGATSLFRPYRDLRFSKDKSPYKTHQGGFVEVGPSIGWYVHVDAEGLFVAGGFYGDDSALVSRFRESVDEDTRGTQLEGIVRALRKKSYDIGGDRLKTRPRGYDDDHPRIELLRHKSLTANRSYGSPAWLSTAKAANQVRTAWRDMRALVEWLADNVGPSQG